MIKGKGGQNSTDTSTERGLQGVIVFVINTTIYQLGDVYAFE